MSDAVVIFDGVRKIFANGRGGPVTAIDDLSFTVQRGEYACILGRSGCGKSTAINLLLGLDTPTAGRISVFGIDPLHNANSLRGRVASVFQSDRLLPWRSAIDNVRLPLEILGLDARKLTIRPEDWLGRLGLQGFENAYPHELSGGMRQRVALARALVGHPDIVLADEAFAHLDEVTGEKLRQDFHRLTKEDGTTVIHITHSIDEALNLSDHIIVVGKPGHVIAEIPNVRSVVVSGRDALRARILARLQSTVTSVAARTPEWAV